VSPEKFDVVIVGAGISGIDAAYHLRGPTAPSSASWSSTPSITLAARGTPTSTRVSVPTQTSTPSATSSSHAVGAPIATAAEIQTYLGEVIADSNLAPHIRYSHTMERAHWSSETQRWTIEGRKDSDEPVAFETSFLWMCQGYYRHAQGYTPTWENMASFTGAIIHPQTWPENLDLAGKRVVVIGSGATAQPWCRQLPTRAITSPWSSARPRTSGPARTATK
jgi:cation diffusion facilitator CzcD-associated flavoprotein CzcO